MNEPSSEIEQLTAMAAGLGRVIADPSTRAENVSSAAMLLVSTQQRLTAITQARAEAEAEAARKAAEPAKNLGEAITRDFLAAAEAERNTPRSTIGLTAGRPPSVARLTAPQRPAAPATPEPTPPEGGWRNLGEQATARFAARQQPVQTVGLRPRRS